MGLNFIIETSYQHIIQKKGGGDRIRSAVAAAREECMKGTELPGFQNF